MTDKSAFTDEEWHALVDAPLLVTMAVFAAGEHGPISMVKEASASARSISRPGERGVANELIGEIVAEANTKEARHEMKDHRGPTPQAAIESVLHDLEPAASALGKLPAEEAKQVGGLFCQCLALSDDPGSGLVEYANVLLNLLIHRQLDRAWNEIL